MAEHAGGNGAGKDPPAGLPARPPVGAASADAAPARPDPDFEVTGARTLSGGAPTLAFGVEVSDDSGIPIHFIALSVLITIEPGMRTYDDEVRERLVELFGEPERWGSTTGTMRWTQVDRVVGSFTGSTAFELPVECSYDHEISTTKYFAGVDDGSYPLRFHFNGTTYYEGSDGRLQILPLAWDRSARFDLPAATWREMIDSHYPRGGWLRLSEGTLRALGRRKAETGAPTMDDCVRGLLAQAPEADRPAGGERG